MASSIAIKSRLTQEQHKISALKQSLSTRWDHRNDQEFPPYIAKDRGKKRGLGPRLYILSTCIEANKLACGIYQKTSC